jgi:NhaP-type Na+/H+ or K+/H+ antiporter
MFMLLICFFIIDAYLEKIKPEYGHVTGYILFIGMSFSGIYYWIHGETLSDYHLFQFRPQVFFDAILPPIVFNAGFNMKRKKFFANLGNIMVTGIGVTFVCFALYSGAMWWFI